MNFTQLNAFQSAVLFFAIILTVGYGNYFACFIVNGFLKQKATLPAWLTILIAFLWTLFFMVTR